MIGQAQTGTGKTAAFLLPFLNRWRPHKLKGPIGLVMAPTRELAVQVAKEADRSSPRAATSAPWPSTAAPACSKQLDGLARGCDLVVGTPGRMLDHLRRGSLSLDHVRYVVLDEADRMLDIGFRPDIERILQRCPLAAADAAHVGHGARRRSSGSCTRYMTDPVHLQHDARKADGRQDPAVVLHGGRGQEVRPAAAR